MSDCQTCGKTGLQPDSIHTCTPLALRLAERMEWPVRYYDDAPLAAAELRRLHTENAALRADAERYRWLRDQREDDGIAVVMKNKHIKDGLSCAENINNYIDAARGEK